MALQLLGKRLITSLVKEAMPKTVATGGDTGSAAIDGVRGQKNIDIYHVRVGLVPCKNCK